MSQQELPELDSRPQGRREWSGAIRSLVLPLAFVVAVVAGLLYWQTSTGGRENDRNFGTVALPANKNPTGQPPLVAVGRAAPDFVLPAIDDTVVQLSDKQGHPLVVSFFTTWCDTCRSQMPVLVEALGRSGRELQVIAINLQEADGPVGRFAAEYAATFPILLDRDGDVASTWRVGGRGEPLPATFFIDASGVVRHIVEGPVSAAQMAQGVSLIAGGQP